MRGKAALPAVPLRRSGITPAYAGKRPLTRSTLNSQKDHPRLCGEKLLDKPFLQRRYRITPAYAGKRLLTICDGNDIEDHPRLCGEKELVGDTTLTQMGSPPPMRGKVGNGLKSNFIHGITPAYAGKRRISYEKR